MFEQIKILKKAAKEFEVINDLFYHSIFDTALNAVEKSTNSQFIALWFAVELLEGRILDWKAIHDLIVYLAGLKDTDNYNLKVLTYVSKITDMWDILSEMTVDRGSPDEDNVIGIETVKDTLRNIKELKNKYNKALKNAETAINKSLQPGVKLKIIQTIFR